ncbi:MAG: exodeoxyribonuclease VII large subunit [Gammaproteobacteria bacterium]|nr:MAG: exodeoxyribonuclease VII large subunit [Gammaproteobacteria bacterium]
MYAVDTGIEETNATIGASQAFSVSEINAMVADLLVSGLPGFLWVEGEVSNLSTAGSGHRYLSLKDKHSAVSCALFRGAARRISSDVLQGLKNGDKIIVKASISVYKPRGSYQLIISDIEPAGFGTLAKAFAALKNKLDQAGLTAREKKRPIPGWPGEIVVITSATGAAIRDVLTTLKRRAPFIPVRLYTTLVQGQDASQQIVQALRQANQDAQAEVILLVRGGGSLEDLMAFNDEAVAYAIADSQLPVVTGIGHQTDFTIADFVSDYRAPTPTAAAEIVSPDKMSLVNTLGRHRSRLFVAMRNVGNQRQAHLLAYRRRLSIQHPNRQLQQHSQRLDEVASRLSWLLRGQLGQKRQQLSQYQRRLFVQSPQKKARQAREQLGLLFRQLLKRTQTRRSKERERLDLFDGRLTRWFEQLTFRRQQLKGLEARLLLLSPLGVLERGYALAFDDSGQLIDSVKQVTVNSNITLRLSDGTLTAVVTRLGR